MKRVQVHKYNEEEKHISAYYWNINTDIDTDDRIMRLYGLQFGYAMKNVHDHIYQNQYGETYIVVRN